VNGVSQEPILEKILIVDDLPANSRVLAILLRTLGYQVATAESGVSALRLLSQEHVGVVLLDLMMPEMDGFDVLRTMRADPRLHDLPVVIYSATDCYRDEAFRLGAQKFVTKGNAETFSAICEAIEDHVGRTYQG
jgi:adenylate cyclase